MRETKLLVIRWRRNSNNQKGRKNRNEGKRRKPKERKKGGKKKCLAVAQNV